ncbi:MAG: HEAT repeat domain-containing protein [Cyanobacteria bacterium J06626_18]
MNNADRLNQLENVLRNGSINESRMALDELAQMPPEKAVPILRRLTQAENFQTRRLAMMGLGNHRADAAFQVLKDVLAQEQDANVLAEAANSLFEFGQVSLPLLQDLFLRSSHWLLRQSILSILMEVDQGDVLLAVVRVGIEDATQTVKETAILALGPLMNSPWETEAISLLSQTASAEYWRDRWRSATTLSLSDNPEAKQLLASLRQDKHHYVVAAALEGNLRSDRVAE